MSKRRKINSFLDYPNNEWLLDEITALKITLNLINKHVTCNNKEDLKILMPGVGKSKLAYLLYTEGFSNLTLIDIEPEAVLYQTELFHDVTRSSAKSVVIFQSDILHMDPSFLLHCPFDLLIDKGFMDVFLRQGCIRAAWDNCLKLIHPTRGRCIVFSMFHAKWKPIFNRERWLTTLMSSLEIKRFSRTRPTIARYSNPIACFFADMSSAPVSCAKQYSVGTLRNDSRPKVQHEIQKMSAVTPTIYFCEDHKFTNFHKIKKADLPIDASEL